MRRFGLLALLPAVLAAAAPARAADMAVPPSYYPPAAMPPAIYNWSGIYAGGQIGAGLLFDTVNQSAVTASSPNLLGPTNISAAGAIGGAQVGVNYQLASVVLGAEVSWTASDISGTSVSTVTAAPIGADQDSSTSRPSWLGVASGRIGYAFNTILLYAKGGAALMGVDYIQQQLKGGLVIASQSIKTDRSGYTAGAGLEYGMTENLSARLEYNFYGFGSKNLAFAQTPVAVSSDVHTILAGLNYRFNWANGFAVERCPTC